MKSCRGHLMKFAAQTLAQKPLLRPRTVPGGNVFPRNDFGSFRKFTPSLPVLAMGSIVVATGITLLSAKYNQFFREKLKVHSPTIDSIIKFIWQEEKPDEMVKTDEKQKRNR